VLDDFRKAFEEAESKASIRKCAWLRRPFYSIAYLDGDNMGEAFRKEKASFKSISDQIALGLSCFTASLASNSGDTGKCAGTQKFDEKLFLIYAGGDDVNFMTHPECLLDLISRIADHYQASMPLKSLTLSAGAVVCPHKFPLSEAIKRAYETLLVAKKVTGKNATAIQLIKGHSETLTFALPNRLIPELEKLKEWFASRKLPMTLPYKIARDRELLEMLGRKEQIRYISETLSKTREQGKMYQTQEFNACKEEIMECLFKILYSTDTNSPPHIQSLIDALLYTRFLTGGR
jgi:CRISPR/Cas system-associated protein Cas10 (large subunit of type III CRISPR-Cas system)